MEAEERESLPLYDGDDLTRVGLSGDRLTLSLSFALCGT